MSVDPITERQAADHAPPFLRPDGTGIGTAALASLLGQDCAADTALARAAAFRRRKPSASSTCSSTARRRSWICSTTSPP